MVKSILFLLVTHLFIFVVSQQQSQPQKLTSLEIENTTTQIENKNNAYCSYKVSIDTSCSSTSFTRDQISLSFGDANGNQVYAPRLDDPSSRTFERCSTDTFHISGPCMYSRICYVYLYRVGSDGWKPASVKIDIGNYKAAKFDYNTFVPYGVWFGFNFCNNNNPIQDQTVVSASAAAAL